MRFSGDDVFLLRFVKFLANCPLTMDHPLVRPFFDWSFSWHLNESARNEYNEDVNMIIIDIPILYTYIYIWSIICLCVT